MKRSLTTVTVLIALLAVSTLARGADSTNTSGAADSKVMTQTHDTKASGGKDGDSTKGGRPATQTGTTTRP